MITEEFNMEQLIPAPEAAKALRIPLRTMNHWLNTGEIQGEQSITGRWSVPVGELFRVLEARGFAGKPAESDLRERLRRDVLPKYQEADGDGEKGGSPISTGVLCLT